VTTRDIYSKTILRVGGVPGAYDSYDEYRKVSSGANTPRDLRLKRTYLENAYDAVITSDYNGTADVSFNVNGPFTYPMSVYNLGGKPKPIDTAIPYPDPYALMGKLAEKWKQSTFNAGVYAAEGKEALEMMHQRLVGLHAAAQALRRRQFGLALRNLAGQVPKGNRREALRRLDGRDVSGAWLELNLGWSPMMKDIFEATDSIGFNSVVNRVRASTYNFSAMEASGSKDCWYVEGGHKKHTQIIVYVSREPSLRERWGLTDPAGIAWEATRLSFVIDWFLPIGSYLANLHAVGALPVTKVVHTNFARTYGKSYVIKSPVAGVHHRGHVENGIVRNYEVRRRIYDSLFPLIGTVGWLPASVKPKWAPNVWRVATASALLDQALRKLK
jgi:hypothetical protein